jgi:hypothetical protein
MGPDNVTPPISRIQDPLIEKQWLFSKAAAHHFQIPVELVAGTVAVEIVDDTDWWDAPLDIFFQQIPLAMHSNLSPKIHMGTVAGPNPIVISTDMFLEGYEHYWGLLGGRGPGNGVANVHIATAKDVEAYFATYYADQGLLTPAPNIHARAATLLSDEGNIYYTAAILRMLADTRTGVRGAHTNDLSDFDMMMVYGRFRCYCWRSEQDFATSGYLPNDSRGNQMVPFILLYRNK